MSAKKIYLIVYNATLFLGWSAIFIGMCSVMSDGRSLLEEGEQPELFLKLYQRVETLLKISQTAAILEIIHCIVKIVPSSPVLTGFQVLSRLFVLWMVTDLVPSTQKAPGVMLYLFCWTITEIIRYSYYFLNILESVPYFLMWCRYTFFFVLYPVGVAGELITIFSSLPVVKKTGFLSLTMPNSFNFSFNYYTFLLFVIFCYVPIFPQLYCHMIAQRKKFIGSKNKDV